MLRAVDRIIKYLADRLFALVAIIALSPIFFIITIAIKLDSKGKAIFSQTRSGKGGAEFKIYKFRTMVTTDIPFDSNSPIILDNDISLTRVGKVLRASKLDELPQLFNILIGDMSFVGPRPFLPAYLGDYKRWELAKFDVLTGLTGLSQVNGNGYLSTKERSYYDVEYAKHRNIFMDIGIIIKTVLVVVLGEDYFINHISEDTIRDTYHTNLQTAYGYIPDNTPDYYTNCKRIAQVVGSMHGGVAMCILNYYRAIDRSKFQFDFYTYKPSEYDKEIRELGGNVYYIPTFFKPFPAMRALKHLLKNKQYFAIHCNLTSLSIFPLYVAKQCGINNRICHAHSTTHWAESTAIIKNLLKRLTLKYATEYVACSRLAGDWFYGNRVDKFTIIPNAIPQKKFATSKESRSFARKQLGIKSGTFVVGTVGRLVYQKNQIFLLRVFKEAKSLCNNACLLIVGEGKRYNKLNKIIRILGLEESVIILSAVNDIALCYNAMDTFVLPSKYEGLPLVGIEAQCAGLKCIFSDKVTKEVDISTQSAFIPISQQAVTQWAKAIVDIHKYGYIRKACTADTFNIKHAVKSLQKLYFKLT